MVNLRHTTIFFTAAIIFLIIFVSSRNDIRASDYLNKVHLAAFSDAPEAADFRQTCNRRHSILYADVEKTEAYWKRVGGMIRDDLELSRYMCERDGNCVTLKVYNGTVYIRTPIEKPLSFQSRAHSMLLMLSKTDLSHTPNTDFLIDNNDGTRTYEACFLEMDKHVSEANSKSRREAINHFLFPDFTMFDWFETKLPPFDEARLSLSESAGPFSSKIPKLFWRGAPKLQQGTQRTDLIAQLGNLTEYADIADVAANAQHKGFGKVPRGDPNKNYKSLAEMCEYQYIVYTEGVAYSGRLKYTSTCNSVQIGMKINYKEFWTHILEPYYVTVKDWDDALSKYQELRNNPSRAEALAAGARDVLRKHLSPTGVSCYIQRMLEGYARSQRWTVRSPAEDTEGQNGEGEVFQEFHWVPLDHFLTKMLWLGTEMDSQHSTKKIVWS